MNNRASAVSAGAASGNDPSLDRPAVATPLAASNDGHAIGLLRIACTCASVKGGFRFDPP